MFHFVKGHWRRLWLQRAPCIFLSVFCWWGFCSTSAAQERLTLTDAVQRALANHPELQVFELRFQVAEGMRRTAELRPVYELGMEAENLGGSGEFSGVDKAEITLSLSSVIELGNKRGARVAVADSRYALVQAEREAKALDLLALVTQSFITTLSLQKKLEVAREATQLAKQSYESISTRVQRGATPEAERLRAQAALQQAKMQQDALASELASRKFALASLWQAERADFDQVSGDLFNFATPANFDALYERVAESPAIQVFASEQRLHDAEVALARSQSASTVRWSLGVRRYEDSGDSALTAGISVPLFSERRNRGELQAALAEREMVQYGRETALLAIRARLFEAWQTYHQSTSAAQQMHADVLPALEKALEQTRQAYERGRYSYVDWLSAQRELLDARMAVIDAAAAALLNQALIEQLTATPLTSETFASKNGQALDQANESPRR